MITNVTSSTEGVVFTLSNGDTYTVTNGKNGANGTVWTIGDDGYWYCDGVKTNNPARGPQGEPGTAGTGTAGDQGPAGNYYVPNPETGTFWLYNGATNEPIKDTEISFLGTVEGITAVDNGDEVLLFNVNPEQPKEFIRIAKSGALKSIVLIPELYADGIEAVEYGYNWFKPWETTDAATKEFTNNLNVACEVISPDTEWNYTKQAADFVAYNPIQTVSYHLNPSAASVKANQVSIISGDVETISRASEASIKKEDSAFAVNDGIMTIGFSANGPEIKTKGDGEASIFAAQVRVDNTNSTAPDTTITSDYAMLYASQITPQAIAFDSNSPVAKDCPEGKNDELFTTVGEAIPAVPTLKVAYNSTLDLSQLEIHYNWATNTKNAGEHKVLAWGDEEKYGMTYDFALINYTSGSNATSESKYCQLSKNENGHTILTPRAVNAEGEPDATIENAVSSVGRQPLVRVRVMQGNNVVLVGFIKVEIVKEIGHKEANKITFDVIKFGCDDAVRSASWSQISNYILQNTAVTSKVEFDAQYQLEMANDEAVQYKKVGEEFVKCTDDEYVGTAAPVTNATGTTTDIVTWTLALEDQQTIYEQADHKKTIYVAYVYKVSETLFAPIYLPLEVSVEKPVGTVTTKVQANWMRNQEAAILNVPQPTNGKNPDPYTTDLNKSWSYGDGTSKPNFNPTEGYASYTPAILANQNGAAGGYKFYFTADNCRQLDGYSFKVDYTAVPCILDEGIYSVKDMGDHALYVNPLTPSEYSNSTLSASKDDGDTWEVIAEINQATGEITYQKNDLAKELLNKYASNGNGLDRSNAKLFAEIGICAYSPCGVALKLTGAVYPAYFLRPINVYSGNGTFTDAIANGSKVKVASLLSFDDWRGQKFADNEWLLAYYDVKKVTLKLDDLTSTAEDGENFKKLNDVTAAFSMEDATPTDPKTARPITWVVADIDSSESAAAKDKFETALGTLVYDNQNITRNTFKVKIPVEIEYYWGTIQTEIIATVNNTLTPQN